MIHRQLEYVDKPVSRVVFGTAIETMMAGECPYEL
jgi:hypothetical protein